MEEFDENLEEKWVFTINKDENLGGSFGDVYFGTMHKKDNIEHKIPVVLKTSTNKAKNKQQQQYTEQQLKKEQEIFKILSKLHQDDIVKCYGIAHIDEKEYIVMEDLRIQGFETISDVYEQLITEKSGDNTNIINQYNNKLDTLYRISDCEKQKGEINKYKQHYNKKFKQKEEKNQNKMKVYHIKKKYVVFLKKQNILKS